MGRKQTPTAKAYFAARNATQTSEADTMSKIKKHIARYPSQRSAAFAALVATGLSDRQARQTIREFSEAKRRIVLFDIAIRKGIDALIATNYGKEG